MTAMVSPIFLTLHPFDSLLAPFCHFKNPCVIDCIGFTQITQDYLCAGHVLCVSAGTQTWRVGLWEAWGMVLQGRRIMELIRCKSSSRFHCSPLAWLRARINIQRFSPQLRAFSLLLFLEENQSSLFLTWQHWTSFSSDAAEVSHELVQH